MKKKHARRIKMGIGMVIRGCISLVFYTVVIIGLLWATKESFQFGYDVFNGKPLTETKGEVIRYTVEEGDSIRKIAADLEELGLIENQYIMIVQKVFYNVHYKPGTFELNSGMTSKEMLDWMTMISHSVVEETEAPAETTAEETQAEETTAGGETTGGETAGGEA